MTDQAPSNRRFGTFFTGVFSLITAYLFWAGETKSASVLVLLTIVILVITLIAPRRLTLLNKLWMSFGRLLGSLFSPLILGFLFFGLIMPMALVLRCLGRDELRLREPKKRSYWVERGQKQINPASLENQY